MSTKKFEDRDAINIALTAVLTAVVVVFTLLVRVPTPIKGYISLCDVIITTAAYLFAPYVAALSGGLGTAIADIIGGYAQWAPFSFLIHGLQGLLIAYIAQKGVTNSISISKIIISGVVGIVVMSGGYYLAGALFYGFEAALVEVPLNVLQSGVGVILGAVVSKAIVSAYPPVRALRGK